MVLFLLGSIASSCFFPEEFKIKINIDNDGTYSLVYDGILTFVPAKKAEVAQGEITAELGEKMQEFEQEFLGAQNFKKAKYIGHGQFRVVYERTGTLDSTIYFLNPDIAIISITPITDQQVEMKGIKLNNEHIEKIHSLKMKLNGQVKVTTNAEVIEHNAHSAPKFFGIIGAYDWNIKLADAPAPYMLLELK
jgi:hypothetical protein